jgi:ribose transport system ATP-binding protein
MMPSIALRGSSRRGALVPTDIPAPVSSSPVAGHSALTATGIGKRFGGLRALDGASVEIISGHVLALCGANGAGKSTLVKILAGVDQADTGEIAIDGSPIALSSPQDATDLGLSFVHQELNLVPKFTGLQNMAMGAGMVGRSGLLDTKRVRRRAQEVIQSLGYDIPLDVPVDQLSVSDRWMVSLGRSLMRPARFVAMDEPTASFTAEEAERLYGVIKELTASGVGILYISHRLDEVLAVADTVTVMRNGRTVGSFPSADLDVRTLTHHIVGHEVEELVHHRTGRGAVEAPVRLAVRELTRWPHVQGASFDLHEGEILGLAGLVGAGRTELARLVVGADRATSGSMTLGGTRYSPKSPHDAIRAGVVLVPEERRTQGLILSETIDKNMAVAVHGKSRSMCRRFSPRASTRLARALMQRFSVKAESASSPILSLSGGNQQKVVLGKYVRTGPTVLVLDEPTIGVDVGARAEIYEIILALANEGTSVLVISSDFDELAICDRVLVMRHGQLVADVPAQLASKNHLTRLCFFQSEDDEPQGPSQHISAKEHHDDHDPHS